ncbi:MAG: TetR/AcrR family transcriptional regulator [Pseudomonadota bacterium]
MTDAEAPSPKSAEILQAAHALFMEQGYGATSMDAVAARAGVSKRTIYSHFDNKEGLFSAMITAACARRGGADFQRDAAAEATPSPRDFLQRYGYGFVSIVNSPEGVSVVRIVFHEAERFPDLAAAFFRTGPATMIASLAAQLTAYAEDGALRVADAEAAAWKFLTMLKGRAHLERMLAMRAEETTEEKSSYVREIVDDFLALHAPAAPTSG